MSKERIKDLVSIVITNFNNEGYIVQCLESMKNQTYKNLEIIVIDDASTDNSVEVINDWIKENSEKVDCKLIELKVNVGFAGAVTVGLYSALGEYIAFHDGDDYSNERRIEKQVEQLKSRLDIGVIGCNYAVFNDSKRIPKNLPNYIKEGVEEIRESFAKGENPVCNGSILFKGSLFDKIGGLTRRLDGAEDYEFLTKLLSFGMDNIMEPLYYYRTHSNQRSRQFYGNVKNKKATVSKEDMSILMIIDRFNIGGTETHVLSLVKGFIERGIKVTLLADDGPLGDEFNKLSCKVYNMKFPYIVARDLPTINAYKGRLKRIIEAENINMIHCHQSPSGAMAIAIGKDMNIPVVFTIHGLYYDDITNKELQEASGVVSVSHPVYEWLLRFGIQSKIIPNGIIFRDFESRSEKNTVKEELSIPEEEMVVTYCSRMAWGKIKVCENLIRVVRDLRRAENLKIHAVIVGDGPGLEELKKLGDKVNNLLKKEVIHFVGGQTSVERYFECGECIIGTGRVAIEGMASSKPVIAAGNNGYAGILTEDNLKAEWKNYFGDHNSTKINNAGYFYDDLKSIYLNRESMSVKAEKTHEIAKEMFNINVVIEQLLDVYANSFGGGI